MGWDLLASNEPNFGQKNRGIERNPVPSFRVTASLPRQVERELKLRETRRTNPNRFCHWLLRNHELTSTHVEWLMTNEPNSRPRRRESEGNFRTRVHEVSTVRWRLAGGQSCVWRGGFQDAQVSGRTPAEAERKAPNEPNWCRLEILYHQGVTIDSRRLANAKRTQSRDVEEGTSRVGSSSGQTLLGACSGPPKGNRMPSSSTAEQRTITGSTGCARRDQKHSRGTKNWEASRKSRILHSRGT